jgi:hypothetical protein
MAAPWGESGMSALKFAIGAIVVCIGVMVWKKHQHDVEAKALATITDERGFIALAQPSGAEPKKVWIVAAVNCPKEGAQRADELARRLADRNMSFDRRSGVSFSLTEEDPLLYARIDKVMNGETPIVFINGRVKANPELDEVVAEYEAAQR